MENPADFKSHKSYTNTLCVIKKQNLWELGEQQYSQMI